MSNSPSEFRKAVESLRRTKVRPEIRVEPIRPPQRLAPWTYALSAEIPSRDGGELATGRLVLLYDPDGVEAWDGVLRLVAFASAEIEPDIGSDPLLPEVGWSWLTGALADRAAAHRAAGGTVTQTTSTRFGDLHGPRTTVTLELRGSWTADTADLRPAPARVRRSAQHGGRIAPRRSGRPAHRVIMADDSPATASGDDRITDEQRRTAAAGAGRRSTRPDRHRHRLGPGRGSARCRLGSGCRRRRARLGLSL